MPAGELILYRSQDGSAWERRGGARVRGGQHAVRAEGQGIEEASLVEGGG